MLPVLIVNMTRVVIRRGREHGRSNGNTLLSTCRRRSRLWRSLKDLLLLLLLLFFGLLLLEIVSKTRLLIIHVNWLGFNGRVACEKLLAQHLYIFPWLLLVELLLVTEDISVAIILKAFVYLWLLFFFLLLYVVASLGLMLIGHHVIMIINFTGVTT